MPDRVVFLDAIGWIALLNSSDALHRVARCALEGSDPPGGLFPVERVDCGRDGKRVGSESGPEAVPSSCRAASVEPKGRAVAGFPGPFRPFPRPLRQPSGQDLGSRRLRELSDHGGARDPRGVHERPPFPAGRIQLPAPPPVGSLASDHPVPSSPRIATAISSARASIVPCSGPSIMMRARGSVPL